MEYLEYTEFGSVREARIEDAQRITELAKQFYDASPYNGKVTWDYNKTKRVIKTLINCDKSIGNIWVGVAGTNYPVGMLACMGVEPFFSSDKVASEVMWWISPEFRGSRMAQELVGAYEEWCRVHGYRMAQMVLLEALNGSQVERFYTRKGYELTEKAFVKVF